MGEKTMLEFMLAHKQHYLENNLPHEGFDIMQTKWCGKILFELCQKNSMRFGELKKSLPDISNVVLTSALKSMAEKGLVIREQYNEIPPHVEYSLTPKGKGLIPICYQIARWEEKFSNN